LFISEPDQSTVRATMVALSLDFNVMPVHALADWHSATQIDSVVKKNIFFMAISPCDKIIYISGDFALGTFAVYIDSNGSQIFITSS
jgi:hypothetical protein